MNVLKRNFFFGMILLSFLAFFTGCTEEGDGTEINGTVEFEITDAPIDNTNISGVFVTVAEVKVDGEPINGFSGKQTIDLMAYQNGNTKALGIAELEAGTYNSISLVLDYTADEDGNAPGCYVLTQDNVRHNLQATSNSTGELEFNGNNLTVAANSTTELVLDFDIRKAIREEDNVQPDDEFDFVTESELEGSVRVILKDRSGNVNGSVEDNLGLAGDRIVVYAYQKGSFDQNVETQGQGESNIMFKNAVTSAVVAQDGSFQLSFLEEGEYELHFVGYEDDNSDGRMEAKGMLKVISLTSLDVLGLSVEASANVNLNVSVLAVLPF